MGILLNSFGIEAFCYIFWVKGTNAHFGPDKIGNIYFIFFFSNETWYIK